jgi:twitching motility protein PilT
LLTLLRCLDRDDIHTLELVSGELARAVRATGVVPLTKTPLTAAQIEALLQGTPMADALAANSGTPHMMVLTLSGRPVRVVLQRQAERTRVAMGRPVADEPGVSAAAPPAAPDPAPSAQPPAGMALSSASEAAPAVPAAAAPPSPSADAIDLGLPLAARAPSADSPAAPAAPAAPVAEIQPATPAAPVAAGSPGPQGSGALAQLTAWVQEARAAKASDVHLIAGEPWRYRVAGQLTPQGERVEAATLAALVDALIEPHQRDRLEAIGYFDLAAELPPAGRVRLNISRHPRGFKICLRLVPLTVPTLEALGLPEDLAAVCRYHQGLAIVSGPSGHGKTATLAALVNRLNHHSAHHIILVEDPVEVVHPVGRALISQRQVGRDTQSYARALKAALREDPDVIVVGELRDRETVEIALGAAETGHLVLATMNTRSAAKTIDRLIDLFPPEDQAQVRSTLAGSLKMVISQRLLPSVDGGQVPAVELLTGSVPLWALIRDNKLFQLPSLQQRGRSAGMIRLDTSLLALVQAGKVAADVARAYAENPLEFDRLLAGPQAPAATGSL